MFVSSLEWIPRGFVTSSPRASAAKADGEEQELDEELVSTIKQYTPYVNISDDPNIVNSDVILEDQVEEEMQIMDTDDVLVVGKTDYDYSVLEIVVLEDESDNMFVYKDLLLYSNPLSLRWIKPNLIAVGTMEPFIEVWDVNSVDSMVPAAILGGVHSEDNLKTVALDKVAHTGAVISIDVNEAIQETTMLVSGSQDMHSKIWDLNKVGEDALLVDYACSDIVKRVEWRTSTAFEYVSITDNSIELFDVRKKERAAMIASGSGDKKMDVECGGLDPNNQNAVYAFSYEEGNVYGYDIRKPGEEVLVLKDINSGEPTSSCSFSFASGILATTSGATVNIWDLQNFKRPILSKTFGKSEILTSAFYRYNPWILAFGGTDGEPVVWDLMPEAVIREEYSSRL